MTSLQSIDLDLFEELKDDAFRNAFFEAEASAAIARAIIELRQRRGLNQSELADLLDTKQPAISRIEKANYRSWSYSTLKKIAHVLRARLRVIIEPFEDVHDEYRNDLGDFAGAAKQPSALDQLGKLQQIGLSHATPASPAEQDNVLDRRAPPRGAVISSIRGEEANRALPLWWRSSHYGTDARNADNVPARRVQWHGN
ncbi:MAG: helix-turn-helix domain-containing protein [Terricaulis sp.]|nr:helix-turn-helix domain-containing protein [Terricaulis sp.]